MPRGGRFENAFPGVGNAARHNLGMLKHGDRIRLTAPEQALFERVTRSRLRPTTEAQLHAALARAEAEWRAQPGPEAALMAALADDLKAAF